MSSAIFPAVREQDISCSRSGGDPPSPVGRNPSQPQFPPLRLGLALSPVVRIKWGEVHVRLTRPALGSAGYLTSTSSRREADLSKGHQDQFCFIFALAAPGRTEDLPAGPRVLPRLPLPSTRAAVPLLSGMARPPCLPGFRAWVWDITVIPSWFF